MKETLDESDTSKWKLSIHELTDTLTILRTFRMSRFVDISIDS